MSEDHTGNRIVMYRGQRFKLIKSPKTNRLFRAINISNNMIIDFGNSESGVNGVV